MSTPPFQRRTVEIASRLDAMNVFFVVGCQKSGTTWMQHLLDGHPHAACGGEGHLADAIVPLLHHVVKTYNGLTNTARKLTDDDLCAAIRLLGDRLLASYLDRHPGRPTRAVGDRTPEGAMGIPLLDRIYPGCRIVHVIRDGRDGAVSGWAHLQRQGRSERFPAFADYAGYYAEHHWRPYIETARATAPAGRYLEVRYEALHADPRPVMIDVLRFLDLDASEGAVRAVLDAGSFERLSGGRARGEECAGSHFRKGMVGDWRERFDDDARRRFDAAAGPLLSALGYAAAPSDDVALTPAAVHSTACPD